ncbi:MAG: glycosyltransferase [Flavobacteriales bacterium]
MKKMLDQDQVLVLSSYPSRVCGIATYTKDLVTALNRTFTEPLVFRVCALEEGPGGFSYPEEVTCTLNTLDEAAHIALAARVNRDQRITRVWIQHEFGLYNGSEGAYLLAFAQAVTKPITITFHTVLPNPAPERNAMVRALAAAASDIVVLTARSARMLREEYGVAQDKITVIPHGTHVVRWEDTHRMKQAHGLEDRLVLSTFGLLSTNKSIETAIDAMPAIIEQVPNALYLILGRTHPDVVRKEGEHYREFLEQRVAALGLQRHVRFVDRYFELNELLEHLQLTDVYLFTSKDPDQAVSGTFAYALGCGCPVISTRIPHAQEMLEGAGILIDFNSPQQLAEAAIELLADKERRMRMSRNALHRMRATSWDNVAIAHVRSFRRHGESPALPALQWPSISLDHVRRITDGTGMMQFCDISEPDPGSGYTLDDNARALIAVCMHHGENGDEEDKELINTYVNFIERCQLPDGRFLNYMDQHGVFHKQNHEVNLADANGRAIWALGSVVAREGQLPKLFIRRVEDMLLRSLPRLEDTTSPRAIGFTIKGLHAYNSVRHSSRIANTINALAERLLRCYAAAGNGQWKWFEPSMTYGNAVLPEAMLLAYLETGRAAFRDAARASFDFLLSHMFKDDHLRVISNRSWLHQGVEPETFGEQPIDVAYTIVALDLFHTVYGEAEYQRKMGIAFEWFLGRNHLDHVIYNSASGGCFDGLEEHHVNLNQGAESTVCYLISRMVMERSAWLMDAGVHAWLDGAGSGKRKEVPHVPGLPIPLAINAGFRQVHP